MGPYYIGLMSGTSTDGVDAVLADFKRPGQPRLLAESSIDMPSALRQELLALNTPGPDELSRAALAANALVELYAQACTALLGQTGIQADEICAIGAHGQTVRHAPEAGYSWQLNAPAYLVELTGIPVIADFRSRDIAAGGQGAPLVPAFHQALFGHQENMPDGLADAWPRAVLNLGGIANVSLLSRDGEVRGFDTGPANVLLDHWAQTHLHATFDQDGAWADTGSVHSGLLKELLGSEPWFDLPAPKSTGRDRFNAAWLDKRLAHAKQGGLDCTPADVQATLQALTATSVANALAAAQADTAMVIACGGGTRNSSLLRQLRETLPCPVHTSDEFGVPVQSMEALAFAWLAWAHDHGHPAGLPSVTGARRPCVLGCKYPA